MRDVVSMFLLLATRDRTGRPMGYHALGFGAAVLAEMVIAGNLELDDWRVRAGGRPEDPLLLTVWHDVRGRAKRRRPKWWMKRLSGRRYKLLRRQFTERLVDEGILDEARTWFGGFRYPERDPSVEAQLRHRVVAALDERAMRDERMVALVAIVVAARSGAEMSKDRRERRRLHRAAKRWVKEVPLAGDLKVLVDEFMVAAILLWSPL